MAWYYHTPIRPSPTRRHIPLAGLLTWRRVSPRFPMVRYLTGFQPTGALHLVKYFGAFRPSIALAGPRPLWTNPSQLKPALDLTEAEAFNVSNGHPTGGFVLASNQTSESETESAAPAPRPTPVFRSAAGTEAVPLPTKKPDRSFVKEAQPNAATLKRTAQRPRGREPKSMRFGIIGYNYNPQQ